MKVIARSANAYLIEIAEDYGRVLDLDQERLFPSNSIASILARGYWEPFDGDQEPILSRLGELEAGDPAALEGAGEERRLHRHA